MTVASHKELVCSQCGFTGPTDALPHRCPNCGADAAKLWVIDRATAAAPRRRQWGRGLALVIVLCLIPLATDDLDLSPPKRPKEPEIAANPGFAVVIPKPPPKQPKAQATASRPPDQATAAAEPNPAGAAAQKPVGSPPPGTTLGQPAAVQRLAASAGILDAVSPPPAGAALSAGDGTVPAAKQDQSAAAGGSVPAKDLPAALAALKGGGGAGAPPAAAGRGAPPPPPLCAAPQRPTIVFIIDGSVSMGLPIGTPPSVEHALDQRMATGDEEARAIYRQLLAGPQRKRLDLAKSAFSAIMDALPTALSAGLVSFRSCRDVEFLAPVDHTGFDKLREHVDGLAIKRGGETAITASIRRALTLIGQSGHIVLITDGAETCHDDPCGLAASLPHGITIDVVDMTGETPVRCLATLTGGTVTTFDKVDKIADVVRVANAAADKVCTAGLSR